MILKIQKNWKSFWYSSFLWKFNIKVKNHPPPLPILAKFEEVGEGGGVQNMYHHCSSLFKFVCISGLLPPLLNIVYVNWTGIQLTVYSSRGTIVIGVNCKNQESWIEQATLTLNDSSVVFWCFVTWKWVIF